LSNDELGNEQEYVSMLYAKLDELREWVSTQLTRVLLETGGTPQARSERDSTSARYSEQIAQYNAAENGLCFGRLDFDNGERRYVGRLGIRDENDGYTPLLIDWRAPAARPFYLATASSPDGVTRRRHIKTRRRRVVAVDDEVLDLTAADAASQGRRGPASDAALLAAVGANRTGRMHDIVETIQAEQDRVIRSDQQGVLVVQGGPGTGKTAVALHRAAYLLYTHRRRLSKTGVLLVGPNTTFLSYIGQVLPSLGETGVLLRTVGDLYPGVSARRTESPEAAAVKGRIAMADVLAAAVRDRQGVPDDVLEIPYDSAGGGDVLRLDRRTATKARTKARRSRKPHNQARAVFVRELIEALTRQVAGGIGADVLGGDNLLDDADLDDIRREVRSDPEVRAALNRLWPRLAPQRLLTDLYGSAARLATAAPQLTDDERELLRREPGGGWTPADVPLLDEAAELLGRDDRAVRARQRRRERERVDYAQGVLDVLSRDVEDDPEVLMAYDLIDPDRLAERHVEEDTRTAAERAAADRQWAFGHVIVDEAQELSEMAWRALMRRCPSRSMTIVGDVAQTGDLAGTSSWRRVLEPYLDDRWRLAHLTVNYRTPAEIMDVAADVLAQLRTDGEGAAAPRSVRETGVPPWRLQVPPEALADALPPVVADEAAAVGDGRLAVLVPASRLDELGKAVAAAVPGAGVGDDADLENTVVVLSVRQAKGLEFDSVLVVDPDRIVADSPRGTGDLYVALTRATQRLGVVHDGELPAMLGRLHPHQIGRHTVMN
jgi:DNA helicase IV